MDLAATLREIRESRLRLAGFVLDLDAGELRTASHQLADLRKQALEVLLILGAHAGHVVGKDDLMQRVWPSVVVGEDSLVQAIADIRRVLGDREHRLVRNVPRRGYMLVADDAAAMPASSGTGAVVSGGVAGMPAHATAADPASPAAAAAAPPALAPRSRGLLAAVMLLLALAVAGGIALIPPPEPRAADAAATLPTRSIVVLPFEDPGGSADDAWFVDAVTADLTTSVGRHKDTLVIGRGTAAGYKGRAIDPRVIARDLGVRYVVRGAVRRDGDRVRLDVSMVDGESGAEQWSRQFDIDRARLRESIGDISGNLGKTLFVEMSSSVGQRVARMKPEEVEADDLAMQGFAVYLKSVSADSFNAARRLFEQALAKDPNSVRALSGLSMASSFGVTMQYVPDRDAAVARAEETLARLESIDANHVLTLLARNSLVNMRADWEGQYSISRTLIDQYPNEPSAYHMHCSALLRLGRHAEGIPSCQRAIRISPRDSRVGIWWGLMAFHQYLLGQHATAAASARESVAAMPKHPFYVLVLAASLVELDRKAEAEQLVHDYMARNPAFETAKIATTMWPAGPAGHPSFTEGRDRIAAMLRELGMP